MKSLILTWLLVPATVYAGTTYIIYIMSFTISALNNQHCSSNSKAIYHTINVTKY